MVEEILQDYAAANKQFTFAALRYFNASGCATDGTLGEDHDPETHLIPVILQRDHGLRPRLIIFGTDYPPPTATNVRDYIHVDDLADAHIAAMTRLDTAARSSATSAPAAGSRSRKSSRPEKVTGKKAPVEFRPPPPRRRHRPLRRPQPR